MGIKKAVNTENAREMADRQKERERRKDKKKERKEKTRRRKADKTNQHLLDPITNKHPTKIRDQ